MRGLYGIADAGFGEPLALGTLLLSAGVCALQLRCKDWPAADVAEVARRLHPHCRRAGVPLILNDHLALVEQGLGDGVHLGQGDGGFSRSRLPAGCLVGRSTHDLDQLRAAVAEGVDYVGFGPIYSTATKPGALPARGLTALRQVAAASPLPVVAIGGITPDNLHEVRSTGVQTWTAISAVLASADPLTAARRMQ
jgi:thiamine-phosphate pyrophosphorylase